MAPTSARWTPSSVHTAVFRVVIDLSHCTSCS
jgi:hypothetical protein